MQKETKIFLGILFIVAVGIITLRTPDQQEITGTVTAIESQNDVVTSTEQTREYNMRIYKYGYDPDTIRVKKGDRIRITMTSSDTSHGFAIAEYGISEYVQPGLETVVEFVADRLGEFRYYCNVPCGRGHRTMEGTLIVE